jgi:hypothetical protein
MGVDPHDFEAPAGPPLGELLVARRLITPEQLEQALAVQRGSGRPLGEIFVRLGFTTGPMIAQALATQHGRMFKSEYGFATGFDAVFSKPEDPPGSSPSPAAASPATAQPARPLLTIVDPIENDAPAVPDDEEHVAALELERHFVFFPAGARGYVLLERHGPVPAVGDILDTSADGGSAVMHVTKVAWPPIPGPKRRCAYLL